MSLNLDEKSHKYPIGNSYNGFSAEQRDKKFKALKQLINKGYHPRASGPCALCGDPDSQVEYHSEDYGEPFVWIPPGMYALCIGCHRDKIHKRFMQHDRWLAFIAHVRRGGYSKDLKEKCFKHEFESYRRAIACGKEYTLKQIRPYKHTIGEEWFAKLSLNPITTE